MIKFCTLLLGLLMAISAMGQTGETITHRVKSGETKYGISRQYSISIEKLEKYNPDIKTGLKAGMTLLIPAADEQKPTYADQQPKPDDKHLIHRVKKGETLYSLARRYEVTLGQIEKLNPELRNGGLKEGMVLLIPKKGLTATPAKEEPRDTNFYWHTVKPGETAWFISQLYDIGLDSLYLLNPDAETGIRLGQDLKLPLNRRPRPKDQLATDSQVSTLTPVREGEKLADTVDGYILYPVKTGDTFYNLKQRFLTDREELLVINPELSEGLKVDKYILIPIKQEKLPGNFFDKIFNRTEIVGPDDDPTKSQLSLRDSLNVKDTAVVSVPELVEDTLEVDFEKYYRVAVLLPFFASSDTSLYEDGINPRSAVAVDFYNALLMAADTLVSQGMNLQLKVYDTENRSGRVRRIISELKNEQPDLVIGPLFKSNVEQVAESLEELDIKVVSPLSRTVETAGHPNLIKCLPGSAALVQQFASSINQFYRDANIIFLDYPGSSGIGQTQEISQLIARIDPLQEGERIQRFQVENFDGDLRLDSILDLALEDSTLNLVVSLSEDRVFLSSLVGELRGGSGSDSMTTRLMVSQKVMDINTLDLDYLNGLEVTMPGSNFINYQDSLTTDFIRRYRALYSAEPTKYAFQGYDVGLFFLNKLWRNGPYFPSSIMMAEQHLGTGFQLQKAEEGGYENQYMILTRMQDYELVVLSPVQLELD